MILCVAANPAWDVTYGVERLRENATNRAHTVSGRAGGKAVNVARVLHALGEAVTVVAPVGGRTGEQFAADLAACGVPLVAVESASETRRTVTVVSDLTGDATVVNEPGEMEEWRAFLASVDGLMPEASVVVAAGSLPASVPLDAYGQFARSASAHDVPIIVDTSGVALSAALSAAPYLVKPNLVELRDVADGSAPGESARRLALESGAAVVVSLGAAGMLLAAQGEVWYGSIDRVLRGNPTGAGDAAVAAFARGIRLGSGWPEMLADAVALSGAAVLASYAGEFAASDHRELATRVVVERAGAHT